MSMANITSKKIIMGFKILWMLLILRSIAKSSFKLVVKVFYSFKFTILVSKSLNKIFVHES